MGKTENESLSGVPSQLKTSPNSQKPLDSIQTICLRVVRSGQFECREDLAIYNTLSNLLLRRYNN